MSLDSPNSVNRHHVRQDCHERLGLNHSAPEDGRADLSRHVQRLFDERGNCRPHESANRFLPHYSGLPTDAGSEPTLGRATAQPNERQHQDRTKLLLDSNAPPQERLAAVRELSRAGVNGLSIRGNDGESYKLRLETEQAGARQLVHLYVTGADGKEHTVLRGVSDRNGCFNREQDSHGNPVGWCGTGAAILQGIVSTDNPDAQRRTLRGAHLDELRRNEDRQFAPPDDRSCPDPRLRQRPFEQPPDQNARQWMDRASQDARNQTRQLVQTTAGVYLRSGMAVDADGSPRARQIDPDGQVNTSMRYADNRSVNAEVVPYMVLPGGAYQRFGVKLGDMALVRNTANGKMAVAVFADVGPRNKTGEGSMELARELGLNPSPTRGGTSNPSIEYLVLPNTHGNKPRNEQELLARIVEQRRKFGIS